MDAEKRSAREARTLAKLQAIAAAAPPVTPEMLADLQKQAELLWKRPRREQVERRRLNWRHQANKRHAAKLRRTPPWADLEAIRALHAEAQRLTRDTGIEHHVDHVIPLQGRLVSGLHVHTNMQVLTGPENSRKWNRFEPEVWADSPTYGGFADDGEEAASER